VVYALVLCAFAGTASAASVSARLQQVEDHLAIERVLMEYGRALDSRDFAQYSQLFAKDGEWSGSLGTFRGPAAIKAAMEESFKNSKAAPIPSNFHLLTNAIIDVQGDRATAWSKWTFMTVVDNKPVVALAGQYEDTLVRESGQWKFLRRTAQTPTPPATPGSGAPRLSTQDYIDIQQLVSDYSFRIDECSNAGYDYADLYTPDGEFAVSDRWGGGGKRTFVTTGREALARVAGGRDGKCIDPKSSPGYGISHVTVNLVITPTADGAVGKSYLLALGVGGDPTSVERQGGYEDVYVKTAAGWRFKTRTHVWPNMADSVMFKKFSKQLSAPTSGAQEPKR
jgi:hypothetical protein